MALSNIKSQSQSITSAATNTTSNSEDTRTKAELWNELKILSMSLLGIIQLMYLYHAAFTRTLTTLYASTLLSLLTTLQLTLLARGKYVHSIIHAERQQRLEERMRERMERELSPANLLMKGVSSWVGSMLGRSGGSATEGLEALLGSLGLDNSFGTEDDDGEDMRQDGDKAEDGTWLGEIDDELENKFLTMSWWLLHVGWKDVGERVQRAAEEVFNGLDFFAFYRGIHAQGLNSLAYPSKPNFRRLIYIGSLRTSVGEWNMKLHLREPKRKQSTVEFLHYLLSAKYMLASCHHCSHRLQKRSTMYSHRADTRPLPPPLNSTPTPI